MKTKDALKNMETVQRMMLEMQDEAEEDGVSQDRKVEKVFQQHWTKKWSKHMIRLLVLCKAVAGMPSPFPQDLHWSSLEPYEPNAENYIMNFMELQNPVKKNLQCTVENQEALQSAQRQMSWMWWIMIFILLMIGVIVVFVLIMVQFIMKDRNRANRDRRLLSERINNLGDDIRDLLQTMREVGAECDERAYENQRRDRYMLKLCRGLIQLDAIIPLVDEREAQTFSDMEELDEDRYNTTPEEDRMDDVSRSNQDRGHDYENNESNDGEGPSPRDGGAGLPPKRNLDVLIRPIRTLQHKPINLLEEEEEEQLEAEELERYLNNHEMRAKSRSRSREHQEAPRAEEPEEVEMAEIEVQEEHPIKNQSGALPAGQGEVAMICKNEIVVAMEEARASLNNTMTAAEKNYQNAMVAGNNDEAAAWATELARLRDL